MTCGVVVIGRNEGQRLVRCLASLSAWKDQVVYVDSGSTDGSIVAARQAGAAVVALESGPFTAARGRQAGLDELQRRAPGCEYVQFVDGDCIIEPGWMEAGIQHLLANPRVGAVCGRLREERVAESFYSRMIDLDWDLPCGRVDAVGGNAMMRIDAIRKVGGWRTDLIAGEEPELALRLIGAGYELERLAAPMVVHDIAIDRFGQYWRRAIRTGHAYAEIGALHDNAFGRQRRIKNVKNIAYGLLLPAIGLAALYWCWPVTLGVLVLHALLAGRVALPMMRRGHGLGTALAYGEILTLCKTAMALGAIRFYWSRVTGHRTRLIEYKQAPAIEPASKP